VTRDVTERELKLWTFLVGAMLADEKIRLQAKGCFDTNDVPPPYRDVFTAIIAKDGESVRQLSKGWGIEVGKTDRVLDALVRKLQELSLERFCRETCDGLGVSAAGLTPGQYEEKVQILLNRIQAKRIKVEESQRKPDCNPPKTE
jgi:hypothetical protein